MSDIIEMYGEAHIIMKNILIGLIRFYRKHISSLSASKCRYFPTCSSYALESIERYGAYRGSMLAIKRILRCHPFREGGFDPVP